MKNIKTKINKELKIIHKYYSINDINKINNLDLDDDLLVKKLFENILIYDTVYKTSYGVKALHIIFDKIDGYIKKYNKNKYLALFHSNETYERMLNKITCLIMLESNRSYVCFYKSMKIKINWDDALPLEKH